MKFESLLAEEAVKHQAKMQLIEAKTQMEKAHGILANHELWKLSREVYRAIEAADRALEILSRG